MFNKTKVEDSLVGIVGLRQPLNPTYSVLDTANLTSSSGYFVTDLEYVKTEYIKDAQDFEAITDLDFNILLRNKQKSAIANVCNLVFTSEDFIDRNVFYANANNNTEAETLPDGFVGFKIQVAQEKNIAFEIPRIILDFQSQFSAFTLYLFNTGDPNPLESKVITITEQHQTEELGWVVDNTNDAYKGDYYIGYIKDVNSPIPFKRNYQAANNISSIKNIGITRVKIEGHTGATLWDLQTEDGMSENTGLNPDLMVFDDYTDFIIQNQRLFARAIQLDMGIGMMTESIASLRSNRNTRVSEQGIVAMVQNLDGVDTNGFKIAGLRPTLAGAIKTIKLEIEKLRGSFIPSRLQTITLT